MKRELFNEIFEALAKIRNVRLECEAEGECDVLEDLTDCINTDEDDK